jgi:hypothetical protein
MAKKYTQNIHHQLWCTSALTFKTNYTTYTHCTIHINVGRYMWRYAVTYWHALHSIHFHVINRGSHKSIWSLIFYRCTQNYCFTTRISFVLVKCVNPYALGQYKILWVYNKYMLHYESWIFHGHYQNNAITEMMLGHLAI